MAANLTSFLLLALLLYGRSLRFINRRRHIQLVLAAFAGDLILVLALVMMKDALSQVSPSMHWTLKVHIPFAVSTLVFYALAARAGYRLWKGDERARPALKRWDKFLLFTRVMTLATSLMVTAWKVPGSYL